MKGNLLIGFLTAITLTCGIGFYLSSSSSRPPSTKQIKPSETRSSPPLVLVGVDAATLRIIEPLLQKGQLPAFARLKSRGVHGVLRSIPPGQSPQIWTSVATGAHPSRHGIDGFLVRPPGRPISTLLPVSARRVPAIWNLASQQGRTVGVVGWWATWPAEPVNGFVVTHTRLLLGDPDRGTYPARLEKKLAAMIRGGLDPQLELQRLLGEKPRTACPRGIVQLSRRDHLRHIKGDRHGTLERLLCRELSRDAATVEIARSLYTAHHPDLLLVYLRGIDTISHRFWKYAFPQDTPWRLPPSPEDLRRYKDVILGYYRFTDGLLGRLIDATPRATVVVVSDHGFGPRPDCGETLFNYNLLLSDLDYLSYSGTGFDWSKTHVVHDSVSWHPAAKLYLNLVQRSPKGIIPSTEYNRRLTEISHRLASLRTASKKPLFIDISPHPTQPDKREVDEPDITLRFNPALEPADKVRIGKQYFDIERYRSERDVSGGHYSWDEPERLAGILLAAGPGIVRRKKLIEAGVLDVMPTITCLLGIPLYTHFEGKPLTEVLGVEVLRRCGQRRATIREDRVQRPRPVPAGSELRDEQLRKKLRSLGYID